MKTNNIVPYKKRKLDPTLPVDVYRCLPRKGQIYSIRQKNLVVGHATHITLKDCKFHVNKAGQLRARISKERNVHAHIKGMLDLTARYSVNALNNDALPLKVEYQPFKFDQFTVTRVEGKQVFTPIEYADEVIVNVNGVTAYQQLSSLYEKISDSTKNF
jgi:hypothetical protein